MKHRIIQSVRLFVALTVFILCLCAFFEKFYPVPIFDVQVVSLLQSVLISGTTLAVSLLILLGLITFICGRVYCSTVCPLGLFQELLIMLFKPFYKRRRVHKVQPHYIVAYIIAALLFGTLLGGTVVLLRWLDPYAVAGNALSGAWYGLGFAAVLAVLVFFKKRFFCANLCPVGAVLGLVSRYSLFKMRIDADKCKKCGICAKSCPAECIDFKNHNVDNEMCLKCFKCLGHCQHGAIQYGLPQKKKVAFDARRRDLLKGGIILLIFGRAVGYGMDLSSKAGAMLKKVILPAGAEKKEKFANRCLNCNLCVKNCPMKIIKSATKEVPFVHLDLSQGYCKYDCHNCSKVCPSGAIKKISLADKQKTKIATAMIDEEKCIKCGLCAGECPVKTIVKEVGEYPLVRFEKCLGCGKCAQVCPVKAIALEPADEQVLLS